MKLTVDTQKLQHLIDGITGDLGENCESSQVPIYQFQNELGETCQLILVATKDPDRLISDLGGVKFHCLSAD